MKHCRNIEFRLRSRNIAELHVRVPKKLKWQYKNSSYSLQNIKTINTQHTIITFMKYKNKIYKCARIPVEKHNKNLSTYVV